MFVSAIGMGASCLPSCARWPWWRWCSMKCLHWHAGQTPRAFVQEGGSLWLPCSCHDPQGQGSCASHSALGHDAHVGHNEKHMIYRSANLLYLQIGTMQVLSKRPPAFLMLQCSCGKGKVQWLRGCNQCDAVAFIASDAGMRTANKGKPYLYSTASLW